MRERSPIDAFFDPHASQDDVLRAIDVLLEQSSGAITHTDRSPSSPLPAPGGLFCETLFGPLTDETARATRWAHVELARSLRHPCGVRVEHVPVIPPGDRPRIALPHPTGDRWFAQFAGSRLAADNDAYRRFVSTAMRLRKLVSLDAPDVYIQDQLHRTQECFDELWQLLALPLGDPARHAVRAREWVVPDGRGSPPAPPIRIATPPLVEGELDDIDEDVTDAYACAWLTADRVLVRLPRTLLVVEVATGDIASTWPAPHMELLGAHGGRALFAERETQHGPEDGVWRTFAVLDPETGWLAEVPADMPLVLLEGNDDSGTRWLHDVRTAELVGIEGDPDPEWTREIARTPDHAFIWIDRTGHRGAIHEVASGLCWLHVSAMELDRYREPWLGDEAPPEGDRVLAQETRPAFARAYDRWRILDAGGSVSHDGVQLFRIGRDLRTGAFDLTGDRLAIVGPRELSIIDVPGARYLARIDLTRSVPDSPR